MDRLESSVDPSGGCRDREPFGPGPAVVQHPADHGQPEEFGPGRLSEGPVADPLSRRITLTDAGKTYVAACRRILEEVVEAERVGTGEYIAPKGELNATAPIVLGRFSWPVLAEFLPAYPDIDIRLTLSDRLVDLTGDEIDVALRLGELPDSGLIATRFGTIHRVFAASPGFLELSIGSSIFQGR